MSLTSTLSDFCLMAIPATNVVLRRSFYKQFDNEEIPDRIRGAPALRKHYISRLLQPWLGLPASAEKQFIIDCIEKIIQKYRYANQGSISLISGKTSLPGDVNPLLFDFVGGGGHGSGALNRRHYDTGKQQEKFQNIKRILSFDWRWRIRERLKRALLLGYITPRQIASLDPFYVEYFFRHENAITALEEKLITVKQIKSISSAFQFLFKNDHAMTAMRRKLITPEDIALMPSQYTYFINENAITALQDGLITPQQMALMPSSSFLQYIFTEDGITALRKELITPEEIASMPYPNLVKFFTDETDENGIKALLASRPQRKKIKRE